MIVDIVVGIVLFISALIAFIRGFVREVLTIAGVLGGLAAAYFFGESLIPIFRGWFGITNPEENTEKLMGILPYTFIADGLAYLSIFLVVIILISIVSHFISEGLKNIGLGPIDRTFGVIFGLARGLLLLGLFYLVASVFMSDEDKENFVETSRSGFYLQATADFLEQFLPEGTKESVEESAKQIEDTATTKDKLKDMKLLQGDDAEKTEDAPQEDEEGYQEPFRDEMNELFRQKQEEENIKEFNQ